MPTSLRAPRTTRRQRLAIRLFDEHGEHLSSLASVLTTTRDRSDRLVVDTIARHVGGVRPWRRGRTSLRDLAAGVHGQWTTTHAPRGPGSEDLGASRSRMHELTDLQLGLLALCLFGGYTYAAAGLVLKVGPTEAAQVLRGALVAVAA